MSDILVVGGGLYGCSVAALARRKGHSVTLLDERDHIGGNTFCQYDNNVCVHKYRLNYFHTKVKSLWDFMEQHGTMHQHPLYILAMHSHMFYSFPVNMMTLYQVYHTTNNKEAQKKLYRDMEIYRHFDKHKNAEFFLLHTVGKTLYKLFFEKYIEHHYGVHPSHLPSQTVSETPVSWVYNPQATHCVYGGYPENGYEDIWKNMLNGVEVHLNQKWVLNKEDVSRYSKIFYSGNLDALFNNCGGLLKYRTWKVEYDKHFRNGSKPLELGVVKTVHVDMKREFDTRICHNLTEPWKNGLEQTKEIHTKLIPYDWHKDAADYPQECVPTEDNIQIRNFYRAKLLENKKLVVGGCMGSYTNMEMDAVVGQAMQHMALLD